MRQVLIFLVKTYQTLLSPFVGQHCRFYPSCSRYAVESIQRHGSAAGVWLALRRLGRCHPWCEGGVDPVPERITPETTAAEISCAQCQRTHTS